MRKGFTLIELLAVVIIIGIILMIAIPPVFGVVNKSKSEAYVRMIDNIENAARLYVVQNRESIANINVVGSSSQITVQDLVNYGVIKDPIKDPKYGDVVPLTTPIEIKVIKKNNFRIRLLYNKDDTTAPVIVILGSNPVNINEGDVYIDAGAIATDDYDGDLTSSISVNSNVGVSVPGTYQVIYNVYDSAGNLGSKTRTVVVNDIQAPTVAFSPNGNSTYAKTRSTTVTVSDSGTINTSSLKYQWTTSTTTPTEGSFSSTFTNGGSVSTPAGVTGGYYLWVLAKDSVNHTTINHSNVFNLDNIIPVITMSGSSPVTISSGSTYVDAGATASDNIDGNITNSISVNSNVNVNAAGTYTITYNVSDTSGNAATQVSRTVIVQGLSGVDYAIVGAGGGGGSGGKGYNACGGGAGGGGGGAVTTVYGQNIGSGASLNVVVGNGGGSRTAGGASSFNGASANGGNAGGNGADYNPGSGAAAQTGGGAGGTGGNGIGPNPNNPGKPGNPGGDGSYLFNDSTYLNMRVSAGGGGGASGYLNNPGKVGAGGTGGNGGAAGGSSGNWGGTSSPGGTGGAPGNAAGGTSSAGSGGGGGGGYGYGSGGGGAGSNWDGSPGTMTNTGGTGANGVVVIRYSGTTQRASGGAVTTAGGYTYHTFASSGTFTVW